MSRYPIDFTMAANASLDKTDFNSITFHIRLSGPAVLHGFVALNGESFLDVPIFSASFARSVQIAVDSGSFSSSGVSLTPDLTGFTKSIPTPLPGAHTIKARAVQGDGISAVASSSITVTA